MNLTNKKRYYKMMTCITLIIMLAMIAGLIYTVVDQISSSAGTWPIIASFLNMLAVLVMGSAFANLFYSHALLLDHVECYKEDYE
ncbi:MAG: hypothetical protein MJ225_04520 [Bacilli bacterium]|nr:hypothetical protein [Bacilli bacterium]